MQWQPIETAPKDGRKLLVYSKGLGIDWLVLYWLDGMWREPANGMGLKREPDYWMPLPPPPTDQHS